VVGVADDKLLIELSNYFLNHMKPFCRSSQAILKRFIQSNLSRSLALALVLGAPLATRAADVGKTFATPEEAVAALLAAASASDTNAFWVIFGPMGTEIVNPDRAQAANELNMFKAAADQRQKIVHESDEKCVLEIGNNDWPFPVPIVKRNGLWFFDTESGKEELLNRRIGKNELSTLETMRAYVEAQRDYASKDRDGDGVLEYAQRLASSPGTKDGLYWPADLDGEISPFGPLVAEANVRGYAMPAKDGTSENVPFQGYYFKILSRQGKHAPGRKHDYLINGNMIAGFAMVAWPAEYGNSGIMTFIVNQQGRVYQKDLGLKTGKLAPAMKTYDPDPTWTVSPE
jgi:hypothetical protein